MAKRAPRYALYVHVTRRIEPEDMSVRGNVMASGDPAFDRETEDWVLAQLRAGNEAAWCIATVDVDILFDRLSGTDSPHEVARWIGSDSLGGCSYESETALWAAMENDYDLLKNATHQALTGVLQTVAGVLAKPDDVNPGVAKTSPEERAALAVELAKWLQTHPEYAVWVDQWYEKNA